MKQGEHMGLKSLSGAENTEHFRGHWSGQQARVRGGRSLTEAYGLEAAATPRQQPKFGPQQ